MEQHSYGIVLDRRKYPEDDPLIHKLKGIIKYGERRGDRSLSTEPDTLTEDDKKAMTEAGIVEDGQVIRSLASRLGHVTSGSSDVVVVLNHEIRDLVGVAEKNIAADPSLERRPTHSSAFIDQLRSLIPPEQSEYAQ